MSLDEPLKDDAGTTTGRVRRRHDPLVMAEVALALVLMMGGALLLRTVHQVQREDRNVPDTRNLLTAWVGLHRDSSRAGAAVTRHELLAAAAAVPGIRDVAMQSGGPVPGGAVTAELTQDSNRTVTMLSYPLVTPNYIRVLGLPILKGRDFQVGDELGAGAAIIDPVAAQRLYPGEEPVGRMIKLGGPMHDAPWVPIIGVMRSPRMLEGSGRYAPAPTVLVVRTAGQRTLGSLLIRTTTPDPQAVTRLQTMLRGLPGVAWSGVLPFDYGRQAELTSRRFLARMFVAMGSVALGLAVLGLYGVLAYAVSRRMREFAVRIALGAEPRALVRMVLHDGFVMLLAGIGIGAFVALVASRWLDAVLIAVLPSDVTSLVLCEVVLVAAGLAAALGPARRAARADPMEILRAS